MPHLDTGPAAAADPKPLNNDIMPTVADMLRAVQATKRQAPAAVILSADNPAQHLVGFVCVQDGIGDAVYCARTRVQARMGDWSRALEVLIRTTRGRAALATHMTHGYDPLEPWVVAAGTAVCVPSTVWDPTVHPLPTHWERCQGFLHLWSDVSFYVRHKPSGTVAGIVLFVLHGQRACLVTADLPSCIPFHKTVGDNIGRFADLANKMVDGYNPHAAEHFLEGLGIVGVQATNLVVYDQPAAVLPPITYRARKQVAAQ